MTFTMTGAKPSEGSSSSSTSGPRTSARAIASICCSPPDSVADSLTPAFRQPREQCVDVIKITSERAPIAQQITAHEKVLVDGQIPKDAPALRRIGKPERDR